MKENIDSGNGAKIESGSVRGATAQVTEGTAEPRADLGKFRSVDALLSAYNSLEAEFTRRSQRLRELEARTASGTATIEQGGSDTGESGAAHPDASAASGPESQLAEKTVSSAIKTVDSAGGIGKKESAEEIPQDLRDKIISDYLLKVKSGAPALLAGGGSYVSAPTARAKTLEDAAKQAAEFFKKYVQGE